MALPKWKIPAGSLGIVPELDIWTFPPPGVPIAVDQDVGGKIITYTTFNADHSTWNFQNGVISLVASGLPYHSYGSPDAQVIPVAQNYNVSFPFRGGTNTAETSPYDVSVGIIGFWLNGVAMYSSSAGDGAPNGYPSAPIGYNYNASYREGTILNYTFGEDIAGGHASPSAVDPTVGSYHYHDYSFSLAWTTGTGNAPGTTDDIGSTSGTAELADIPYYNGTLLHADGHSKILGIAIDGYPVYGPYGYTKPADPTSPIKRMVTGYGLKSSSYRTGEAANIGNFPMGIFVQDFQYVGGGDLDEHNGRYCVTPDYPEGTYAYFVTVDSNLEPVYPYVLGNTYYGTPVAKLNNTSNLSGSGLAPLNVSTTIVKNNNLRYYLVSGRLPLGIQVIESGELLGVPTLLQGVPVSEQGPDKNVTYTFTIRVQNIITKSLADRTFSLTVTNIAPPVIYSPPKNTYLGLYLDGTKVNLQLEAIDFLQPGPNNLVWSLKSGELPYGLTLTPDGLIQGYIFTVPDNTPGNIPNWDKTIWSYLGWDFVVHPVSKIFTFTIQVTDGVNYDLSTYTVKVFPRQTLDTSNDELEADTTAIGVNITKTEHDPILLTEQSDLIPVREGSFYSFQYKATDLDGDEIRFITPAAASGYFDEQTFNNSSPSYPYVNSTYISSYLYNGVYPFSSNTVIGNTGFSTSSITGYRPQFNIGDSVKVLNPTNFLDPLENNDWVLANVNHNAIVRLTSNVRLTTANVGDHITQFSTNANAVINTVSSTLTGYINLTGQVITGYINTVLPTYQLDLSQAISASSPINKWITQSTTGANARIVSRPGMIEFAGNLTGLANAIASGDTIRQIGTGATAVVLQNAEITGNDHIIVNFIDNNSLAVGYFGTSSSNIRVYSGSNIANIKVNNANVYPVSYGYTANVYNVLMIANLFSAGSTTSGNIRINGTANSPEAYPVSSIKDAQQITFNANIGDTITQAGYTGNATVIGNIADATSIPVIFNSGTFHNYGGNISAGNIKLNGVDLKVWITGTQQSSTPFSMSAGKGQYITQASSYGNARVTANIAHGTRFPVEFLSNNFIRGSGNVKLNGATINAYPDSVVVETQVGVTYLSDSTFDINGFLNLGVPSLPKLNGTMLSANISGLIAQGVTTWCDAEEGTVGFDQGRFDQGQLALPPGNIKLDPDSGWMTGQLASQSQSQREYQFEIQVYKTKDNSYSDSKLYTLTVLGDLNNTIEWITAGDLGTIETGKVSDLFIYATSPLGKTIFYELAGSSYKKLPQGLTLTNNGLLSGRVSFQIFSLDQDQTTIDGNNTTFDFTYTFTVVASDLARTVTSERTFTLSIRAFDRIPYENLYLKALPTIAQRNLFKDLVNDRTVFPLEKIYRFEDPWFGLARDIKSLFLAGLSPSALAKYVEAVDTNHFNKRLTFGSIKTAQVLDANFNVKYEVVYLELKDLNTIGITTGFHTLEQGPADVIYPEIANPYYDAQGNEYTTAYPNSLKNMESQVVGTIGYQDQGVLPEWMTSRQADGRQLGFVHAVVLAYTKPGESDFIAYRLKERNFDFNSIDFTVDRYQLDNIYTENYNTTSNTFITSYETTFDRYPSVTNTLAYVGAVDYAVTIPYDQINGHSIQEIRSLGGFDGIKNIKDGQTLVFAQQEYSATAVPDYYYGWAGAEVVWDGPGGWAYNPDVSDNDQLPPEYDLTPGQQWDKSGYIPGFEDNNLDPNIPNRRIGIWQIGLSDNIISLSYLQPVLNYSASISGNVLTVAGSVSGIITPNMRIYGTGISNNTYIVNQLTSLEKDYTTLGKSGTYTVSQSQTVPTTTIYQDIKFNDVLYVRNGFTYGGTRIYYDSTVKTGLILPNYTVIREQINVLGTRFDTSGTRFFENRDSYIIPEQGDKYIKFAKTGVFT